MLDTQFVHGYLELRPHHRASFEEIWKYVKGHYLKKYSAEEYPNFSDDASLKNELYCSIIERSDKFVLIENKYWALREKFTTKELEKNNQALFSDSLDEVDIEFDEEETENLSDLIDIDDHSKKTDIDEEIEED